MNKLTTVSVLISSILLTACASQSGWTPTVDTYNDPNAYRINQDMAECKQLASKASGGTASETAIGAGTGALVGAAGGALLGAIAGSPGTGAALGATVGGLGGGAYKGVGAEDKYKSSYNNCMSGRGHKVIR
jgi:hypothetical protein